MPTGLRFAKVIRGRLVNISVLQATALGQDVWPHHDTEARRRLLGPHSGQVLDGLVRQGLMRRTRSAFKTTADGRHVASLIYNNAPRGPKKGKK